MKRLRRIRMFTEFDNYLFREGTHTEIYNKLGAHVNGGGTEFSVWAPNARGVNLRIAKSDCSGCTGIEMDEGNSLLVTMARGVGGIWTAQVPGVGSGAAYRYEVLGADGIMRKKADPVAFRTRLRPSALSVVAEQGNYKWTDRNYMKRLAPEDVLKKPMAVYEVHLGSWKKDYRLGEDGFLNYRRLADELSEYVKFMGFTHVELIGICEHPFDGSWGYQVTGYYSPTSRYGSPEDFCYFVDKMHREGIGVILDWVPAHFPKDSFSFENFDGTPLYESPDPLLAEYPEWGTKAFDHSMPEVRSFLISNACYWLNGFHIDALRVDAVAAMLYTSFSREKWRPNKFGGTENLDSIAFLRQLSDTVKERTRGYLIAEDSSKMQGITADTEFGGIGFRLKWNLGWMNDTLKYFGKDPLYRGYHHGELTHTVDYAFTENFILVLSHDEVVHLKHSMLEKMPGSEGDKLAGLKALYAFQFLLPGKKLIFMGQELADSREWSEKREIPWENAGDVWKRAVMESLRELLTVYKGTPCLYNDYGSNPVTFEWVNRNDAVRSTVSFIRRNPWNYEGAVLAVCNFTPVQLDGYTCGVPEEGYYKRIFSTYDSLPGETVSGNTVPLSSEKRECDRYENTVTYNLRPYEVAVFAFPEAKRRSKSK